MMAARQLDESRKLVLADGNISPPTDPAEKARIAGLGLPKPVPAAERERIASLGLPDRETTSAAARKAPPLESQMLAVGYDPRPKLSDEERWPQLVANIRRDKKTPWEEGAGLPLAQREKQAVVPEAPREFIPGGERIEPAESRASWGVDKVWTTSSVGFDSVPIPVKPPPREGAYLSDEEWDAMAGAPTKPKVDTRTNIERLGPARPKADGEWKQRILNVADPERTSAVGRASQQAGAARPGPVTAKLDEGAAMLAALNKLVENTRPAGDGGQAFRVPRVPALTPRAMNR